MSKAEILDEIPKLKPDERDEIRRKLDEVDGDRWDDADDPLTSEEKALLDARLADLEAHPETSIPWADAQRAVDLRAHGIGKAQAADLRNRLSTFAEDWNRPEMDIYDEDPAR